MIQLDGRRRDYGRRSAGGIGLLAALIFAVLAFASYTETCGLRTDRVVVPGRVVEVGHERTPRLVVVFDTADGRRVQTDVTEFKGRPGKGDPIRIRHHPDEATLATDATVEPGYLSAWLFGGLAVVFAVVIAPLAFRGRLPRPRVPSRVA